MIATAIVVAALAADVLVPGKPAPAFTPEKFVKGAEFKAFEPGKVYVVEFWATWCGPCVASMPHLTKLQKENPDVVVVGVAGFERMADAEGKEKRVTDFLASKGEQVGFPIALDTDGSMSREWMQAAKKNGIPCSFVVGKDGKVAYIGMPNAQLDEAVKKAKKATSGAKPPKQGEDAGKAPPAGDAPANKDADAPKAP
jgi:thiol-disulfide isomerase/thioredoxin